MRTQCKCHQTCAMLKRPRYLGAKHVMKRKETSGSLRTCLVPLGLDTTFGRAIPFKIAIDLEEPLVPMGLLVDGEAISCSAKRC
jgi:hypothetical protein